MITCVLEYKLSVPRLREFKIYAAAWISLVEKYGGDHHGYFFPSEGRNDKALALFSFESLGAYEEYRSLTAADRACTDAYAYAVRTKCIKNYNRSFYQPLVKGTNTDIITMQKSLEKWKTK